MLTRVTTSPVEAACQSVLQKAATQRTALLLLDQAALYAVRQWEYKPTLVKGVPVPVIVNIAVNFKP